MQINYNPNLVLKEEHTEEEERNFTGSFCGFVLLKEGFYDLAALAKRLETQLHITHVPMGEDDLPIQDLMLDIPGALVTISLIGEPIPEEEAAVASKRALWSGAEDAAKQHTAQLMIAVLPDTMEAAEAGRLYCKIISAVLEDGNGLAVYSSGTMMEPMMFRYHTAQMDPESVPFDNLLYIGIYTGTDGTCGYTTGMDSFGKDELEIINCDCAPEMVKTVLMVCAKQLIQDDTPARWYFTMEVDGCIWEGRRKDAIMVEGHSIQLHILK